MAEGRERVERGGGGEASGGIHQARMLTLLTVAFMTSLARTFIMLNAINASRRRKEESETLGASKKALPRVASLVKSLVAVLLLLQHTYSVFSLRDIRTRALYHGSIPTAKYRYHQRTHHAQNDITGP